MKAAHQPESGPEKRRTGRAQNHRNNCPSYDGCHRFRPPGYVIRTRHCSLEMPPIDKVGADADGATRAAFDSLYTRRARRVCTIRAGGRS